MKRFILAGFVAFISLVSAHAQLAITEVMTGEADKNHPDWWELKNYGTNDIDLTGYSWNDDSHGGLSGADSAPFTGVTVHAGETICVTEIKGVITDATTFRAWWGLAPSVQVVVLNAADPGLGDTGDAVRLWSTNFSALGSDTNGLDLEQAPEFLVQRVNTIDISTPGADGRTITYNTNDGTYSIISTNGVLGAFVAATTADVGSPGVAQDPTPVTITQLPVSRSNTVGDTATFTNGGFSLPPLHYHWFFAGNPIDSRTPGVKLTLTTNGLSILALNNVQLTNAGTYTVIAENGLQSFTNTAVLTVVGSPTAPVIQTVTPQLDGFDAFVGQTLTLGVTASGFPAPSFQWSTNNVPLADQTNSQLSLVLSDTNQTAIYSVHVSNTAGSTNVSFNVRVIPVPNLVITEVMSGESTNNSNGDPTGHGDWFELSNLGNFPVNLFGFRIDDNHQSLAQSAPVTNRTMIQPFESVVFVQNMTPDAFRTWWGSNLPASVQVIAYNGAGQGFSGSGDDVHIWNAAATTDGDQVASVNFLAGTNGVSFGFDPTVSNQTGFLGFAPDGLSVVGVNGAFAASVGGDIGSPGSIVNLPRTSISPTNGGFAISWANQPNWNYTVQYKTNLTDATWTTLTTVTSDNSTVFTIVDPTINTQRFYRVGLTP
ncbi:MAG TPA: lamin tail domain-containing protein [Verrucomicrobiae bacterium]|jgi:hypothetical protein|nr:lamin tail domain-containing protein [Verrucomicrobiae bacterium]